MPSSLTHHWFANQQLGFLPLEFRPQSMVEIQTYLIGAQGPDPLFFYGFIPWRQRNDKQEVNAFGSYLHQAEISEKFQRMVTYLWTREQPAEVRILQAYLLGAMTHYVLDRNVHPYVFYRSGFSDKDHKRYEIYHAQYETMIDVSLLRHYRISLQKHPAKRAVQASDHAIWWVSQMYSHEENKAKNEWFYEAWRDMLTVEKVLYDPLGIKRTLLKLLRMDHSQMFAMMHPCGPIKDSHDYFNASHETWRHPGNGTPSTSSLWDLIEQASAEVLIAFDILVDLFAHRVGFDALTNFCSSLDYSGLLIGDSLKYHDSYYDKQR